MNGLSGYCGEILAIMLKKGLVLFEDRFSVTEVLKLAWKKRKMCSYFFVRKKMQNWPGRKVYYDVKKYVHYRGILQNIIDFHIFFTYLTLMPMNYKYVVLSILSSLIMKKLAKKNVTKNLTWIGKKCYWYYSEVPFFRLHNFWTEAKWACYWFVL